MWKTNKKKELTEPTKELKDTLPSVSKQIEKCLYMRVNSGTKIRNVLGYAIKEFPKYESVLWIGIGHGVGKTISCAELFKKTHGNLHQVTKLRYTESDSTKAKNKPERKTPPCVPEIDILLSRDNKDITQLGYQAPGDRGEFIREEEGKLETLMESKASQSNDDVATCIDAVEFKAMGLRTSKKNQKKRQREEGKQREIPQKKNKKIRSKDQ